jgi:uncharacterized protein
LGVFAALAAIGFFSGFMAGFAGIGGGVVVLPALVYLAGAPIKIATGISVVEAFFATLSGIVAHFRYRNVNLRLGLTVGLAATAGALGGTFFSAVLPDRTLLWLYAALLVLAILMLVSARRQDATQFAGVAPWKAIVSGLGVGAITGILGVGGGWLLLPIMIVLLRVPTKVAVGTTLMVIVMSTFTGSAGKIATGQFDLQMGAPVVIFGVIGAQLGGKANRAAPPWVIRLSLVVLLSVIAVRTGLDLLGMGPSGAAW